MVPSGTGEGGSPTRAPRAAIAPGGVPLPGSISQIGYLRKFPQKTKSRAVPTHRKRQGGRPGTRGGWYIRSPALTTSPTNTQISNPKRIGAPDPRKEQIGRAHV